MIRLPFPPSSLSGHAKGNWRGKAAVTKKWRHWAHVATKEARAKAPAEGDIIVRVRFVPPDRRSDRTNYPNRLKPIFDGLADALSVNDRRFVPHYEFAEPEKPGWIEIKIGEGA